MPLPGSCAPWVRLGVWLKIPYKTNSKVFVDAWQLPAVPIAITASNRSEQSLRSSRAVKIRERVHLRCQIEQVVMPKARQTAIRKAAVTDITVRSVLLQLRRFAIVTTAEQTKALN